MKRCCISLQSPTRLQASCKQFQMTATEARSARRLGGLGLALNLAIEMSGEVCREFDPLDASGWRSTGISWTNIFVERFWRPSIHVFVSLPNWDAGSESAQRVGCVARSKIPIALSERLEESHRLRSTGQRQANRNLFGRDNPRLRRNPFSFRGIAQTVS